MLTFLICPLCCCFTVLFANTATAASTEFNRQTELLLLKCSGETKLLGIIIRCTFLYNTANTFPFDVTVNSIKKTELIDLSSFSTFKSNNLNFQNLNFQYIIISEIYVKNKGIQVAQIL